jgi:hypothetical protein
MVTLSNAHPSASPNQSMGDEDFADYVAHLQFHMTLQARNLVPDLSQGVDSRTTLLRQTQATAEKYISRQS